MTHPPRHGLAARFALAAACLLGLACTISPPLPAGDKVLVDPDAPVFDPRFRGLDPGEIELSRFWTDAPPPSGESPSLHADSVADLVDRVGDGVVNVYTRVLQEREARIGIEPNALLPFRIPVVSLILDAVPFTLPVPFRTQALSLGSAFLINDQGYLLTNAHVVLNATDIVVVRSGRRDEYPARIIGIDPITDTALLHIDPQPDMTALPLGDSESLRVGEMVVAVGNPLGLRHTVTSGLVSAKERVIPGEEVQVLDYLQTDTAINPGSSGGPLLNFRGEVVGINTAIISDAQSIGFAIPIAIVKRVMPLLVTGRTQRGWFGATARPPNPGEARELGHDNPNAVVVDSVVPGSPAEEAGLKVNDLVVAINGEPVGNMVELRRHLLGVLPGGRIELTVLRDGETLEISSTLIERPGLPEREVPSRKGMRHGS